MDFRSKLDGQDADDFAAVFGTNEGARLVARLVHFCGVHANSYIPEEGDVQAAIYREGKRSVGLMLLALAKGLPDGERRHLDAVEQRARAYRLDEDARAAAAGDIWKGV